LALNCHVTCLQKITFSEPKRLKRSLGMKAGRPPVPRDTPRFSFKRPVGIINVDNNGEECDAEPSKESMSNSPTAQVKKPLELQFSFSSDPFNPPDDMGPMHGFTWMEDPILELEQMLGLDTLGITDLCNYDMDLMIMNDLAEPALF
jgi:hypothetical protein